MFDIAKLIKDRELKAVIVIAGVIGGIMVTRHYYHQIKLTKLKIKMMEDALANNKPVPTAAL